MRDKAEAARVLLGQGWTWEEVLRVLDREVKVIIGPAPAPSLIFRSRRVDYTYPITTSEGCSLNDFALMRALV